jgi:ribonuclease R
LEGLVVDVEITSWPTPTRPPIGRIIEILGSPDDFGVDVEMMIRKHQLPRIFPEAVLAEASSVAHFDRNIAAQRADFRSLPIVTIDGETARDFDDAVLVRERAHGGYELQVHIADVSEYVLPGSALDLEARIRGTSVYFPDRAIPMLPQELSTDICSLRPNEDRLVLSCIMQLDAAGNIESFEIVEGVIRSAARMTYTDVHAIIEGDEEMRSRYSALVPEFERMKKLAVLMNQRREERGSIDFDLPEPVIEFDEHGQMRGVTRAERTWANRLIEEFMLAANECVAVWLEDLGVPSLYRIHEKPDPRRVVQFEELAASFGYSLGLGPLPVRRVQTRAERRESHGQGRNPRQHEVPEDIAVTPRMYQKLAARIEGKPEERILSYLMLRSLSQARYSEVNEGHFALAAPTYTHFTSPIRRYPDLIVHRIAKALLRAGVSGHRSIDPNRLCSPWSHPNEAPPKSWGAPAGSLALGDQGRELISPR